MSRSRSQGQIFLYRVKGLVIRNIHVKYESPISHGSEVMTKVKVFLKVSQMSRSRSQGHFFLYRVKGLVTRNIHVKYESPISHGSEVMTKVKVFVYGRRQRHRRRRRRGYDNSSPDFRHGELKYRLHVI